MKIYNDYSIKIKRETALFFKSYFLVSRIHVFLNFTEFQIFIIYNLHVFLLNSLNKVFTVILQCFFFVITFEAKFIQFKDFLLR